MAAVAFVGAAVYVGAVVAGVVPEVLLVGVFVPLAVGFEWAIQASTGFCVRLAFLNRYDFSTGDGGGKTGAVGDPEHRRADHEYAAKITVAAVAFAAATTALVWVLI